MKKKVRTECVKTQKTQYESSQVKAIKALKEEKSQKKTERKSNAKIEINKIIKSIKVPLLHSNSN